MIKLLIGGSPCTYWSIAQKNNRETEPSGLGWELFENYLIAKEKFQPVLSHALKDIPRDEKIVVLSMYDGIGTGRYCLDKMGFKNVEYHSYEIDKYAMQIAISNYPDIIQHGDAFQVREEDWHI